MKRAALALTFAAVTGSSPAFAMDLFAEADDPRNLLLVDPGDLFNGAVTMEYERALADFIGIVGGFSVSAFDGPLNLGQPRHTVISPDLGFRFHFIRSAPRGLWLGPYASAGYVVANETGSVARAWAWGAGAGIGYNFTLGRHFTFQLGAAGGFTDFGDKVVWAPRLKIGIGAVF